MRLLLLLLLLLLLVLLALIQPLLLVVGVLLLLLLLLLFRLLLLLFKPLLLLWLLLLLLLLRVMLLVVALLYALQLPQPSRWQYDAVHRGLQCEGCANLSQGGAGTPGMHPGGQTEWRPNAGACNARASSRVRLPSACGPLHCACCSSSSCLSTAANMACCCCGSVGWRENRPSVAGS